mmetsp:Transcript_67439/g.180185  ORF Transcript_67439/g.180185 Transcript_67439/m.180185 type:complete len:89 (-) Transcript_67439:1-267(-)
MEIADQSQGHSVDENSDPLNNPLYSFQDSHTIVQCELGQREAIKRTLGISPNFDCPSNFDCLVLHKMWTHVHIKRTPSLAFALVFSPV